MKKNDNNKLSTIYLNLGKKAVVVIFKNLHQSAMTVSYIFLQEMYLYFDMTPKTNKMIDFIYTLQIYLVKLKSAHIKGQNQMQMFSIA